MRKLLPSTCKDFIFVHRVLSKHNIKEKYKGNGVPGNWQIFFWLDKNKSQFWISLCYVELFAILSKTEMCLI